MFESAIGEIKKYNRIIIHRHTNPDGDAIGSQVGMKELLKKNFPEKEVYAVGDPAAFLEDYRRRSLVVGKDVTVIAGGRETPAHALGIDENCRLLVRYESGETAALSYGEVRIRV